MKCPKCHFDNPEDTRFCGNCGTQLPPSEEISVSKTKTLKKPIRELTTGSTFAKRYEVIEELGKGGMGKVYKVLDKKIKEKIALKLIKPAIAADEDTIERFSNELKFARKISHRNVCRMYDLSEEEGTHFITMEYVSGEELKSFIRRSGQLTISKAISIAKQVCEGLAEAHRLGVVHRDLKPQNIMIDKEGNARIMDFGIARSLEAKGITEAGMMIGTPQYMSPEQVEGKEADQRSDIYSLGVILYEMLTGRVPFAGDTPLSIAVKHKTEAPPDPREVNAQIPEDLSQLILRCMEKDKEKRYQTAEEVLSEIEKIGEPRAEIISKPEWKNSIAVLPFADLSPQKDQEYFCDGMADELINSLTKINDLRVVARTSAFAFKGEKIDVREIGKKLNVETVLEGSVRKSGDRLRITAQLINVADGYHLWSERYDRELEDVFTFQDEISLAIVNSLKVELLSSEKSAILKRHTDDLDAYNLYLKGIYFLRMYTAEGFNKAIEYFERSLQKDPNYALAYNGLAEVFYAISYWANVSPNEAYPKAKAYVNKALEIDDTLGEAHAALGLVYTFYDWKWKLAEQELLQALQLNPNSAIIHMSYSWFLSLTERHEEAIIEAKRAQELDPLSSLINAHVGLACIWGSEYDKAIEELKMTLTMAPNFYLAHYYLGLAYRAKSMIKEAIAEYEKAVGIGTGAPWPEIILATSYFESGKKAQGEKLFKRLKQRLREGYMPPMGFFYIHLARGELDKALDWLEQACKEHDSFLPWCKIIPINSYRIPDEPRFRALLKNLD